MVAHHLLGFVSGILAHPRLPPVDERQGDFPIELACQGANAKPAADQIC